MDPRSTPQGIRAAHFPDQLDSVWANRLATRFARSAFAAPEESESGPVPTDDSARLNKAEATLPI